MNGWTPLFQQIVASSVWGAKNHVRIAWITLLALAGKDGVAPVTTGGLARMANITQEEAQEALAVLSAPDPDTLTQENEGRRIERCTYGWSIINWQKYRAMASAAVAREQNRAAQAAWRTRQRRVFEETARDIIAHLNSVTGKRFRGSDEDIGLLCARLSEDGVDKDGIKKMIDRQAEMWRGTKYADYLRPETLFNRTKFEGYYAARDLPVHTEQKRNRFGPLPTEEDHAKGF